MAGLLGLVVMGAGLAESGCSANTGDTYTPPAVVVAADGTLTVDWTLKGGVDPTSCSQASVGDVLINVTDRLGGSVGTYRQSCTAFRTSITLTPGGYGGGTAVLLGYDGKARTTQVSIAAFTINGSDQVVSPVDFPADSFL